MVEGRVAGDDGIAAGDVDAAGALVVGGGAAGQAEEGVAGEGGAVVGEIEIDAAGVVAEDGAAGDGDAVGVGILGGINTVHAAGDGEAVEGDVVAADEFEG